MQFETCLLASALLLAPVAAVAKTGDCANNLNQVADQLRAATMTTGSVAQTSAPPAARSAWAVTWNRMATASQDAYAATVPQGDLTPSGAQGSDTATASSGWPTGTANTLARARDSLQVARAAHARGDEAACQREIADARQLLAKIN